MAVKMEGAEASGGGASLPGDGPGIGPGWSKRRRPLQSEAVVTREPGLIYDGAVQ